MSSTKNKKKSKIRLNKLVFSKRKKLNSGAFGEVYNVYNGERFNNTKVVKKQDISLLKTLYSLILSGTSQHNMFLREIEALKYLSKKNIAPKIYYINYESRYYVMEKLDKTLYDMFFDNSLTYKNIENLITLLENLKKTPYKHMDLHTSNIMFSNKKNRFYIIDWGIYKKVNKKTCKNPRNNCYRLDYTYDTLLKHLLKYINVLKKKNTNKNNWLKLITRINEL